MLSVEKVAFQDGKWTLILETNWGNGMALDSAKPDCNRSSGCWRPSDRCKSGGISETTVGSWGQA